MKLLTVIFPSDEGHRDLETLLGVLVSSVARHSPATPLEVVRLDGETRETESRGRWLANVGECTRRLRAWADAVEALPDGEVLGLIDADTCVLRDLSEVEGYKFDVAITWRPPPSPYPINAGVVFVRGGQSARKFFRHWIGCDEDLRRTGQTERCLKQFGSVDQAALFNAHYECDEVDVLALPCRLWNCEDHTWEAFDDEVRILHVKGTLRRCALGHRAPSPKLMNAWHAWHTEKTHLPKPVATP